MAVAIASCGNHSIFRMANPEVLSTGDPAALQTTWIKAEPHHDQALRPRQFHPARSSSMTMRTYKNPYPDSEDAVEIRFDHCREDIAKAAKEHWREMTEAELDDLQEEIMRALAVSEWQNIWLTSAAFITVLAYHSHD